MVWLRSARQRVVPGPTRPRPAHPRPIGRVRRVLMARTVWVVWRLSVLQHVVLDRMRPLHVRRHRIGCVWHVRVDPTALAARRLPPVLHHVLLVRMRLRHV